MNCRWRREECFIKRANTRGILNCTWRRVVELDFRSWVCSPEETCNPFKDTFYIKNVSHFLINVKFQSRGAHFNPTRYEREILFMTFDVADMMYWLVRQTSWDGRRFANESLLIKKLFWTVKFVPMFWSLREAGEIPCLQSLALWFFLFICRKFRFHSFQF